MYCMSRDTYHKLFPCIKCGKMHRKNKSGLCYACYKTERQLKSGRTVTKYHHHCRQCNKSISRKNGLCKDCYNKQLQENARKRMNVKIYHHQVFPCRNKCGNMVRRDGGYCRVCYNKIALAQGEKRQREEDARHKEWLDKTTQKFKTAKVDICPKSPTKGHYWIIQSPSGEEKSIGHCKYCDKKKEFLNSIPDKNALTGKPILN